ncbi:enoyl-CoA hydratase/isomerase family protein [Rhodobium gokarnense]|uniref:3-hydroxyisobutyryl-CoA hydrolase n=1 Tax=Rhodobium gokarnense TaxID=364296 RepID=A0ABT3HFZ7_9HYPH|nr:enoyl-CoA hydratase/isomerase family protein [Rhodobium gokarnense]MCW2309325.1 enoyl-CoA hydratase [Rhodobium gokarnense]
MSSVEIFFEKRGHAGLVTLARPQALNALTHEMTNELQAQLDAWRDDDSVRHVVVEALGDKAFCAGGDIRHIYDMGKAGDPRQIDFFRDEYRLNATIKHYPKPYIALINGIVMGGGVGISVHGSHRVATERIGFAMPEVGIGFFPDVGGTYFLPRLPGETGMYCALTGARLKEADARWAGIATHTVASDDLSAIIEALAEADDVDAALHRFARDPGPAPLAETAPVIDRLFAGDSLGGILAALDREEGEHAEFAAKTAATIREKSPTSLHIAFQQMRRGARLSFDDCMRLEYRIVSRVLHGHDFYEGIRAAIIDKNSVARWDPPEFSHVDSIDIDAHFQVPPGGDLDLPDA